MEGELVDSLLGLKIKTSLVMMRPPGGGARIKLIKVHSPFDEKGVQQLPTYTLGIRHIAFLVEDLEALVAKLKAKGGRNLR